MPDYQSITKDNVEEIAKELQQKKGRILICTPGHRSFDRVKDICLELYDNPRIKDPQGFFSTKWLYTERGTDKRGWQTNYEDDRSYWLTPIPKPIGDRNWDICRGFFENLNLKGYEFKIEFQPTTARTFFLSGEDNLSLFIPRKKSHEPAFKKGLEFMVERLNESIREHKLPQEPISQEDIDNIIQYMVEDIKTKETLKHNIQAGLDADTVCF